MTAPETKPIAVGIVVFVYLYSLSQSVSHLFGPIHSPNSFSYVAVSILGILPWIIAGFVAAWIGNKRGVIYAVALSPFTAAFQAIGCIKVPMDSPYACNIHTFGSYFLCGFIFAALGGAIWDLQQMIKHKVAHKKAV